MMQRIGTPRGRWSRDRWAAPCYLELSGQGAPRAGAATRRSSTGSACEIDLRADASTGNRETSPAIDHTLLDASAGAGRSIELCAEASRYGFAAVCVHGAWVERCAGRAGGAAAVAAVVSFPHGLDATAAKCDAARRAVADGARELDVVIAQALLDDDPAAVARDLEAVVAAARRAPTRRQGDRRGAGARRRPARAGLPGRGRRRRGLRQDRHRHRAVPRPSSRCGDAPPPARARADQGVGRDPHGRTRPWRCSRPAPTGWGRARPSRSCSSWTCMPSLDRLISSSRRAVEERKAALRWTSSSRWSARSPPIRPFTESSCGEEISFVLQPRADRRGAARAGRGRRDRRPVPAARSGRRRRRRAAAAGAADRRGRRPLPAVRGPGRRSRRRAPDRRRVRGRGRAPGRAVPRGRGHRRSTCCSRWRDEDEIERSMELLDPDSFVIRNHGEDGEIDLERTFSLLEEVPAGKRGASPRRRPAPRRGAGPGARGRGRL